jgi:hypothetical protein
MLMATQDSVQFAARVGVAPSTTTMTLGAAQRAAQITPMASQRRRYYMPYASLEDLKASYGGLGIVNESDAWLTGRPYGLPGTATVRLTQHPGGYHSPEGTHYDASMVGGGFGDADATLQLILAQQQTQSAALKRMAFWQTAMGALTVTAIVASVGVGIYSTVRKRRHH